MSSAANSSAVNSRAVVPPPGKSLSIGQIPFQKRRFFSYFILKQNSRRHILPRAEITLLYYEEASKWGQFGQSDGGILFFGFQLCQTGGAELENASASLSFEPPDQNNHPLSIKDDPLPREAFGNFSERRITTENHLIPSVKVASASLDGMGYKDKTEADEKKRSVFQSRRACTSGTRVDCWWEANPISRPDKIYHTLYIAIAIVHTGNSFNLRSSLDGQLRNKGSQLTYECPVNEPTLSSINRAVDNREDLQLYTSCLEKYILCLDCELNTALDFEIPVTFRVNGTVAGHGDIIKVSGSVEQLGEWSVENAVTLYATSAGTQTLSAVVYVQAGVRIEYKFIKVNNGTVTWQKGGNRTHSVLNLTQPDVETPHWEGL